MTPEQAVLSLLAQRSHSASICPSDAARALDPEHWRDRMDDVRAAAARLVAAGRVVVTQGADVVDIADVKGPVRIRRPPDVR